MLQSTHLEVVFDDSICSFKSIINRPWLTIIATSKNDSTATIAITTTATSIAVVTRRQVLMCLLRRRRHQVANTAEDRLGLDVAKTTLMVSNGSVNGKTKKNLVLIRTIVAVHAALLHLLLGCSFLYGGGVTRRKRYLKISVRIHGN